MPDSEIDFSDIPPLTDEQLASAFRPKSKELVAVRLDRDVLAWLKGYGSGYSTRINAILRAAMTARRPAWRESPARRIARAASRRHEALAAPVEASVLQAAKVTATFRNSPKNAGCKAGGKPKGLAPHSGH